VAPVSRENFLRLERLARAGETRARLAIRNTTGGPYEARNVIAEIKGREKPDEIVLLGAHLDSWELGTGAQDNGVNASLMIDVARGMKALGLVPPRLHGRVGHVGQGGRAGGARGRGGRRRRRLGPRRERRAAASPPDEEGGGEAPRRAEGRPADEGVEPVGGVRHGPPRRREVES